jgi:ubiquinone/menaquinone biosynthesis C-methylase UbiE
MDHPGMNSGMKSEFINEAVKAFWEQEACGTQESIIGNLPELSPAWFRQIEAYRYATEPYIHSIAQFTRHSGSTVLEVGVGAGTDHVQWARARARCYGVDLTQKAIDTTEAHLSLYGLQSSLHRIDAETLPFPNNFFDVVYSWGVIHHSASPERIVAEIRRVLKPGGTFLGMMYGRHSLVACKLWIKYALFEGSPWKSLTHVIAHHMESPGTKAYTCRELKALFSEFSTVQATPVMTVYDRKRLPSWFCKWIPDDFGWFIGLQATR